MNIFINGKIKRVTDRLGLALIKMGRADFADDESQANLQNKDAPVKRKRGRPRKYERRDLRAED